MAILCHIKDTEVHFDLVLEILRRCSVPWSEDVDGLIRHYLEMGDFKRIHELHEQFKLMKLKGMVLNYGVKDFDISDENAALGMIKFILGQNGNADAMDHALQIVKANPVLSERDTYLIRIQNLCSTMRANDLNELLKLMHPDDAIICSEKTLKWLEWLMQESIDEISASEDPFGWSADAATTLANFLSQQLDNFPAEEKILFDRIHRLFQSYDLKTCRSDFMDIEKRIGAILEYVERIRSQISDEMNPLFGYDDPKVLALAELLGIAQSDVRTFFAQDLVKHGRFEAAFDLCRRQLEDGKADACEAIISFVHFVMDHTRQSIFKFVSDASLRAVGCE
jgi:hypothetical protein